MQGATHGGSAYGVKYQARCISALTADSQQTSFLVGTLSLREENEIHHIKYSASTGDVTCEGLYAHQHEIWDLASCPFNPLIFSTVHASAGDFGATIWRMPEHSKSSSQLEKLAELTGHTEKIKCILWWQSGKEHSQLLSIDEESLYVWDIDVSGRSVQVDKKMSPGMLYHMAGGAWDPHDVESVATVSDSCVQFWDLRSAKQTQALENAHAQDIDYNPQKQHIFATAGDESQIRIWDKRMLGAFFQELPGHHHWTWRVRYNPECDEYLLSSGTDSSVNLWSVGGFLAGNAGTKRYAFGHRQEFYIGNDWVFQGSVHISYQRTNLLGRSSHMFRVKSNFLVSNVNKDILVSCTVFFHFYSNGTRCTGTIQLCKAN